MSTFSYQPVDSTVGEIRLLILHPAAKHDADIQCNLETVNLSARPQYDALSYTWGYAGYADHIHLNAQAFPVRENAAQALRRLRLPKKIRRIWIDAICINQDDLAERAEQVTLMGRIYGQAGEVCVWLGELNDSGIVSMKQLQNKQASSAWHQWKASRKNDKPMLSFTDNMGSPAGLVNRARLLEEHTYGEVRELLDRPWWKRTWVVQEVVLADKIVIMCGSETAPWESIEQLYKSRKWNRLELFGVAVDGKDTFNDGIYQLMSDYRLKRRSSSPDMHLFEVLYRFRLLECTDPRDRIHGFLGLVDSSASMGIVPDYKSTATKAYWQFARRSIHATESLGILNCVRAWQNADEARAPNQAYSLLD